MSPTQSRAFHAVAIAGSFTAASKTLNVSQPTITTQVKELELLYGVELFHRHPRGVALTDVGRELLVIIRRIHANQQDAIQYLQTVQDMRIGHLRIGSYGPYEVIEILAEFTRRYPSLTCSLTFANSRKLHDELLNHNLDVAVFTDAEAPSEFHSLAYNKIKQVAIVGKSHPWSHRKFIHVKDLVGERLIIRELGSEARRATEATITASGVSPAGIIEIGSREGAVAAVAQGVGVCFIFDAGMIPDNLVTKLSIRGADIVACVDVVCLAERKDSRIIGCFLEVAEQLLAAKQ
ncbi:MAG: LysR substrate-binding domain-containing protein [Rhodospirillales bacterium]